MNKEQLWFWITGAFLLLCIPFLFLLAFFLQLFEPIENWYLKRKENGRE
jgi:4-amino-4-deoxy-L-arabinose transferase-like glycosyltransferase